ncbi:hypothetical protein A3860_39845 [Niastella vici]|uniref:Uncharacterized protein n=1 Tax=Niastella vici TaxID=1703345 RepID=A0A1V9FGG1_9BACT|nr:hypothetical protein A3860_39845 [Niastella vici]
MLLYLRSKKTASRTFITILGVGQHAGMSDISLQNTSAWVGQHTGIAKEKPAVCEIVSGSTCKNIVCRKKQSLLQ